MSQAIADLAVLVRSIQPMLHEGVYVYSVVPHGTDLSSVPAIATVHEAEGITLILPEEEASRAGLPVLFRARWITLQVHSDLQAVGFTAAFSRALCEAGIGCNVVAAAYHDHLFVPVELAQRAVEVLTALQQSA
jgi:hypothetical protein